MAGRQVSGGHHLHFSQLPGLIEALWKSIGDEEQGQDFKIFLPNAAAFQQLGEQRCEQLNHKSPQTLDPQGCCLGLGPVLEALKSEISPDRWKQHQSEALPPFSAKASSFSGIS